MMVTFVSECEKKALNRTRRVFDAFANRIGNNTWQTVITEEGLIAVKTLLRKTATKNTAVACHWIRSRSRSELVWIVGNRRRFNAQGIVPVNSTAKNLLNSQWENNWTYLPAIKALVAISALLHDWGKATALFQAKLKSGTTKGDPLRHEWISCLLLNALVRHAGDSDEAWLSLLQSGELNEQTLKTIVTQNATKPMADLPPLAQLVAWLVVSHHRLPFRVKPENEIISERGQSSYKERDTVQRVLQSIMPEWGYQNKFDEMDYKKRVVSCFEFPGGLLSQSSQWLKYLKKWSTRLLQAQPQIQQLFDNGAHRLLLHHARLCLMLGDHYYSSCPAKNDWQSLVTLFANTDDKRNYKQKLDEHLVGVCENALKISQTLSRFSSEMESAYDIKALKQKSPAGYEWQDKAVENIKQFKFQHEAIREQGYGCFIVNMASTGCGKTIVNAKIMRALSDDGESLRYILALGLRTLTLQTGDEYRYRIGLKNDELAVLIGSAAVKELHEQAQKKHEQEPAFEELGAESLEQLLEEDLHYGDAPTAEFLDVLFPEKHKAKHKAFLYKPVLACTIDHIIAATEILRGGKYILPCLRLLSSDLVIDEVDDFDGADLVAIGRLIHLAGMLGRKVMISSATIPPALAEGFFNAYQAGWQLHSHFKQASPIIACAWIDEFTARMERVDQSDVKNRCYQYQSLHRQFIDKRVINLQKQVVKRKAFIVRCDDLLLEKNDEQSRQQRYFEKIRQTVYHLHSSHHTIDARTGKKVSFGVIRTANISPCVALTQFLLQADWEENYTPRIMTYHSRQVLLLRQGQEKHLDNVLKRKEKPGEMPEGLKDPIIRHHLDNTHAEHVMFILVATPVEEVGRDHDFDWAIIEPSSFRSIIQLAGRVRRHRQGSVEQANIAVMQYNLSALRRDDRPAYCRPGYETAKTLRLTTHDLCQLVDETALNHVVNAVPRIQQPESMQPSQRLADLEHQAIHLVLTQYDQKGPQCLQAWLTECWWLTAVPQQLNRFRESEPDMNLYLVWRNGKAVFCEKDECGEFILRQSRNNIAKADAMTETMLGRLWLKRDYQQALLEQTGVESQFNADIEQLITEKSKHYGEITFPKRDNDDRKWFYSDQLGLFQL
ncbi:type I-F CRISPR-associated helicase Cas3 [Nitrosomonas sp. PY1]|uniref:type I-F CRISPR-associated helicase Cas3f n=1 Tax=Nitrosomonas sp. PY1 TaxID=1803906 RepID=UPI001FC7CC2D|nr:type I-F CRISPR-associated helicase Cas3f [Nitrosomonas sp. PY1]GKS68079.1 type I-F CRISPR-associated helicase Cas3 [Nitrosomonas sp. PY1]